MSHSLDLTSGSIWRKLVRYSAPLVVSNLLQTMYNIADMIVAGHFIGTASISAISNATSVMNMITLIIIGLTTGGNILIGQHFGAKNKKGCQESTTTLLSSAMIMGVVVAAAIYFTSRHILIALKAPALDDAAQYLKICSIGIIFISGYNAANAMLRAVGNSRAPLICITISSCMNVILDIIFVVVFRWGIAGTAIATILTQLISFAVAIVIVLQNYEVFGVKLSRLYIKKQSLNKMLALGIPCAVQNSIASISWLSVAYLVNSHGLIISSGNGISNRIKDFCHLFISAMMASSTSMVAQNLGAEKYDRARKVIYTAVKITLCMSAALIVIVEIAAPLFVGFFTPDKDTAAAAILNLRVEIFSQLFYAVILIGHAFMIGAGDTWYAFVSSFINCILFRIPLAFILNHLFGILGVYLACMIAPCTSIPFAIWYDRSNRWRRSLVRDRQKIT